MKLADFFIFICLLLFSVEGSNDKARSNKQKNDLMKKTNRNKMDKQEKNRHNSQIGLSVWVIVSLLLVVVSGAGFMLYKKHQKEEVKKENRPTHLHVPTNVPDQRALKENLNTSTDNPNNKQKRNQSTNPIALPLPNHAKKVTLATNNQYNAKGEAACAFFAAGMAKAIVEDNEIVLHNPNLLDQVLEQAVKDHRGNIAAYIDEATNKYKLETSISTYHEKTSFQNLHDEKGTALQEIKFEIEHKGYKRIAIVRNGPEAWTFFAKDQNHFYITESHGRTDLGYDKAYVLEFNKLEGVVAYIEKYNNYLQEPENYNDVSDEQKDRSKLSFYWIDGISDAK